MLYQDPTHSDLIEMMSRCGFEYNPNVSIPITMLKNGRYAMRYKGLYAIIGWYCPNFCYTPKLMFFGFKNNIHEDRID